MSERDPFVILGVSMDASDRDIKLAYRRLVKQTHPDANKYASSDKIKDVNWAYNEVNTSEK